MVNLLGCCVLLPHTHDTRGHHRTPRVSTYDDQSTSYDCLRTHDTPMAIRVEPRSYQTRILSPSATPRWLRELARGVSSEISEHAPETGQDRRMTALCTYRELHSGVLLPARRPDTPPHQSSGTGHSDRKRACGLWLLSLAEHGLSVSARARVNAANIVPAV